LPGLVDTHSHPHESSVSLLRGRVIGPGLRPSSGPATGLQAPMYPEKKVWTR
jgi:hypothetical protein